MKENYGQKHPYFRRAMLHEKYMSRCLQLAMNGMGRTSPNPLVGAVVVAEGKIIGEGFHSAYGKPHAEVMAINAVQDPQLLSKATLYVNLEPCCHFGKTPPCTDLILKKGIPQVVIANRDPFPAVDGKGVEKLQSAGIEVITGVLEKEGRSLNRRFFTFYEKDRPYIILKWAQTLDGFLDRGRNSGQQGINWITHSSSRQLVHKWRTEESAVLAGRRTVETDAPQLTARDIAGRSPVRIILSSSGNADRSMRVFDSPPETVVLRSIKEVLQFALQRKLLSVIVEGGSYTLQQFLDAELWDEARVFAGLAIFGEGVKAPVITSAPASVQKIWPQDQLITYYNA